jgi:hypothetical protein
MNTNPTTTNTNEIDICDVDGREDETASTTESVFGFTPEEAREYDAMPREFHNTEEELLNFFPSTEENDSETYNKYVEECGGL